MDEQRQIARKTIFYSYTSADEGSLNELEKHLSSQRRQGLIVTWYNRKIMPGTDWSQAIDDHLNEASIILLLISPDYLHSDDCNSELLRALERQKSGEAQVIPIMLRPVDVQGTPLEHLEWLPYNRKPITEWKDLDAAFHEVAKGIRIAIERVPGSFVTAHSPPTLGSSFPLLAYKKNIKDLYRQQLLEKVRSRWITTFLEQSLHGAALIMLDLYEESDMVIDPWKQIVHEIESLKRPLPSSTRIIQAYDYAEGELLLLGEPGSGKTTLLLELARVLLERAEQDDTHSIPVVFNLSSWEERRLPLAEWLVEELNNKYQVPLILGQDWIDTELVLPLLDGLDEMSSTARIKCIETINQYRQKHGMVSLVVCCRSSDYLSQPQRLQLRRAITIQPLTIEQIDKYLLSLGKQSNALLTALHKDQSLGELVKTPLMLSIIAQSYQEIPIENFLVGEWGSSATQRRQVFANYIYYVLQRRKSETRYTPIQTASTLAWIADQMLTHNLREFSIEHIQKDWLPKNWMRLTYDTALIMVSSWISALVFGLTGVLIFELTQGLILWVIVGMIFGLIIGLVFGISCVFDLNMLDKILDNKYYFRRTIMRLLLSCTGTMPWNHDDFLNYAVERILLRKVDNKYLFIHQFLLIYFATLNMLPVSYE